ncbi:MAG TPA: hypothetical protein VG818_07435 [Gemmatimonadaceae bacterium]|nr:hypothetical protein [Gemmatimonadaceae bacterium]
MDRLLGIVLMASLGVRACTDAPRATTDASTSAACEASAANLGAWPNEPSGLATLDNQSWTTLGAPTWSLLWGPASVDTDLTAPFTPQVAARIDFPVGFVGSRAPATLEYDFPARRTVYVSAWWKVSAPWQGHPSSSNKVMYLFTGDSGSMAMIMYGPEQGPFMLRVFPDWQGEWLVPNASSQPVALGTWHHLEWFVQYGQTTDPPSGTVRWWMDGALVGNYCNVRLSSQPLVALKLAPVWGGAELVQKTEDDYMEYGPVHVAAR